MLKFLQYPWREFQGIELLHTAFHDVPDVTGRPLGEDNARAALFPAFQRETVKTSIRGSRTGKNINVTAMKEISRLWVELLETTTLLEKLLRERYGLPQGSLATLLLLGNACELIVPYLDQRGVRISKIVAAMVKTGQGLRSLAFTLLTEVPDEIRRVDESFLTDEVFNLMENEGMFVRGDRACAGPEPMIKRFLGCSLGQNDDAAPRNHLDIDLEEFINYVHHCTVACLDAVILARRSSLLLTRAGIDLGAAYSVDPSSGDRAGTDDDSSLAEVDHGIIKRVCALSQLLKPGAAIYLDHHSSLSVAALEEAIAPKCGADEHQRSMRARRIAEFMIEMHQYMGCFNRHVKAIAPLVNRDAKVWSIREVRHLFAEPVHGFILPDYVYGYGLFEGMTLDFDTDGSTVRLYDDKLKPLFAADEKEMTIVAVNESGPKPILEVLSPVCHISLAGAGER